MTPPAARAGAGALTGLVVVAHSARLAEGVVEVAGQMAPGVALRAAGGTDAGGIGTSFDRVSAAVAELLDAGHQVVVLGDLGSATMTAEAVLEFLPPADRARAVLADGPLVEGAVAAAVAAQAGGDAVTVARAAAGAAGAWGRDEAGPPIGARGVRAGSGEGEVVRTVVLGDPTGLHARPAAALAALASGFDAVVTVDGVDAASPLELMALQARGGDAVRVRATGPEASPAVEAVAAALAATPEELPRTP